MRRTATPAGTDALRAEVFGSVFLLAQYLARRGDEALARLGLTTKQWLLLAVLARHFPGRSPTLTEAADRYGSSRQNVKQLAGQLERRGFLRLLADPADGRALRLELARGAEVFDRPREAARLSGELAGMLAGFGERDLATLHRLLRRWLAAMAPGGTDHATPGDRP
jgi:DNA-binding MarR family transcriptional regulator